MRSIIIFTFLWFGSLFGYADIPKVPSQMEFAGVKLKITEGARAEIQKQVNSLRASDKYFKIKLDRVNLYFPIIERVFKAENLPDDFKYLSIQESALIGDAVSSANAVGFWQFKDFTGREVGLRIDKQVDERMNIVSATRGAAKYMKTNNFYYKNWVYALMAYNTGRGGARKYVKEENYGASKMTINKKTHWYIKTFLAHKIAFQNEIGGKHTEGLFLQEYTKGSGETISKMASKFELDKDLLVYYNKWLKKGAVPTDKTYAVILPVRGKISDKKLKGKKNTNSNEPTVPVVIKKSSSKYAKYLKKGLENADVVYVSVNGIDGILAESGDNITSLAKKGGVLPSKFKKFNDLTEKNKVKSGKIYYLKAKKSKSKIAFHVLMPNENLWDVSQKYGLKLKKLKKYNKLKNTPPAGTVLWLSKKKPKQVNNFVVDIDPKYSNKTVEKEIVSPKEKKAAKVITKPKEKEEKPKKVISKPPVVSKKIEEKQEEITEKKEPNNTAKKEILIVEEVKSESVEDKIEKGDFDIHIVEAGQTLFGLAKQYGVSINDILEWNSLDPYNTVLDIGQKLQLKTPFESPEAAVEIPSEKVLYHLVQPSETAYGISKKYDIEVAQLIDWNQLDENASISIGQKLKVSGTFIEQKIIKKEKVPEDKEKADATKIEEEVANYHEVKPGETFYSLSKKYNISVKDLIRINNKSDASIQIGEKLKIKE